jgi:hypothetical protein
MRCLRFRVAPALVALLLVLFAGVLHAQEERPSLLELIETLDTLEQMVLTSEGPVAESARGALDTVVKHAETAGADDVAARARSLRFLAQPAGTADVLGGPAAAVGAGREFTRESLGFRILTASAAATGAASVISSAVFYYLGERSYQHYLTTTDSAAGTALYRQWKTYDLLSLSFAGGAALTGLTLPLVFGPAVSPDPTAPSGPSTAGLNERQIAEEIDALLLRRSELQQELATVDQRELRANRWKRLSVTVGAIGAITSASGYFVGGRLYERYQDTDYSSDAAALARQIRTADIVGASAAAIAATGFGSGAALAILGPDRAELETKLRAANARLIELRLRRSELSG